MARRALGVLADEPGTGQSLGRGLAIQGMFDALYLSASARFCYRGPLAANRQAVGAAQRWCGGAQRAPLFRTTSLY